ncbi:MAG: arsenosugar biosynthesis radical SAM (seleno)protein ArsS [Acidobacteriota bacterium]
MKSLKAINHELANPLVQLRVLNDRKSYPEDLPRFQEKLKQAGLYPLRPLQIEILQVNVGKMCNQTCAHCHVDAGPDREEVMDRTIMQRCLEALNGSTIRIVDITGGAPEMNPNFQWFVDEIYRLGREIIVRSNLTILTVNEKYRRLPEFFAARRVKVISSLPCYTAENTDKQRGDGVFERSIEALRMLNRAGYGRQDTELELHLVYNPLGAFLPPDQQKLKEAYKRELESQFGIVFNDLYTITNMPISRFLDYLLQNGKYEEYMAKLIVSFNSEAAAGVMCRNTVSVGWDGRLYDCDFNQMLELEVEPNAPRHIRNFDLAGLTRRGIVLDQHCFGCTAGAGSSCGGEIVK